MRVELSPETGRILTDCSNFCGQDRAIFLLLERAGSRRDYARHGDLVATKGRFAFYYSKGGAVSPCGFMKYTSPTGNVAWLQRELGDGPPIDTFHREMQLGRNCQATFVYKARDLASTVKAIALIEAYFRSTELD